MVTLWTLEFLSIVDCRYDGRCYEAIAHGIVAGLEFLRPEDLLGHSRLVARLSR